MPAAGGEAVQITKRGAFRPEESPDENLLYYGKIGQQGVWSTPVTGGPERQVLTSVADQNWTVGSHGIYYLEAPGDPHAPAKVGFYSFRTGTSTAVGTVDRSAAIDFPGISLSPDGRWLLYSQATATSSDLMMIENFR